MLFKGLTKKYEIIQLFVDSVRSWDFNLFISRYEPSTMLLHFKDGNAMSGM